MRHHGRSFMVLLVLVALAAVPLQADPGHEGRAHSGFVTDDPAGEDPAIGFDGAGVALVERFLGGQPPAKRADRRARNISLVGALQLDPFNLGVHGDITGYKNLAFVGKWRGACPGTGVDIIDISRPSAPVKIADTNDYLNTSMEDMQAIRIGTRDALAIGLQDCVGAGLPPGREGLELYDISDPANPQLLSFFDTSPSWYSDGIRVIDISQPSAPREIGFWTGAGAPDEAPAVNIWSVVPHGDLLLASDRNFGLYILKLKP